ncbi:MAG: hypothetical protein P8016_07420, partial [Sedimentisphaerales bacterium]
MKRLMLVIFVIAAATNLLMAEADSAKQNKIEKLLKTDWESIHYSKNVSVYNPRVSSNQRSSSSSESVSVSSLRDRHEPAPPAFGPAARSLSRLAMTRRAARDV